MTGIIYKTESVIVNFGELTLNYKMATNSRIENSCFE